MIFLVKIQYFCIIPLLLYLLFVNLGRVHDIMRRDSNKDPATNPHAVLAKILIDQVE
jgi:hypothetical protein